MSVDQYRDRTFSLDRIFRPRSVAIVGASAKPGPRNLLVKILLQHGFAGTVYPVSPTHPEVEGLKSYPSVLDLPEIPDVALVITPAETVPDVIAECGAKGITSAIVFSAGFEEVEGGKDNAVRLADVARKHNVTVIGPNCQGIWSVAAGVMLTFGSAAASLPALRHAPVAIISQSGALAGAMGNYLQRYALGCAYMISVGNETCFDALDALAWMIEQDDVRTVMLYLEGLNQAERLLELGARARARSIQLVVLKSGRSALGQEATASHTGKIASSYAIYRDVLEQAGIVSVDSLVEAMSALDVLSVLPSPRLSGDPQAGIAIMSASGGAGALLADQCEAYGLCLSKFGPATVEALREVLPGIARQANPVDLTAQTSSIVKGTLEALSNDPGTEALVVQFASSGVRGLRDSADDFKRIARESGLPMILTLAVDQVDQTMREEYMREGILISDDPANSMRALRWLYDRERYKQIRLAEPRSGIRAQAMPEDWQGQMQLLEDIGASPAAWRLLQPGQSATEACTGLNWPVVVKVLPDAAEHKTELGLVKLRVGTPEEVDVHAVEFRTILKNPDLPILIQEMVMDGVEVVLSCLARTDFGPVLSIGSGGVAIELYRDVTYLALPTTPEQVGRALRRLKLWPLLNGFRGKPVADVTALIDTVVRFGDAVTALRGVGELEINPLLVRPAGSGVAAVDLLCVPDAGSHS
jgi:acyl-CoA synthetase (NDP forming)